MWGDAHGNDDGGGYMNDSITAEPSRVTNTVAVGGEDRNRITMPVSLSQIVKLTRPDEGLVIHGQKVSVVSVVARIVEVLESSLHKFQYLLDDYTNGGPLEVQFIRSDAGLPTNDSAMFNEGGTANQEEAAAGELQVNDYIRVFGQVKFSGEKPQIMAYKLMPVVDPNEISMHILEVIRESMYSEKKRSGAPVSVLGGTTNNGQTASTSARAAWEDKVPTLHKHIMQLLQKASDQGMTTDQIVSSLKVPRDKIVEAISALSMEGNIWNGNTDDVWCVM